MSKGKKPLIDRFTSLKNRKTRVEQICNQKLVAGDKNIARRMERAGELIELKKNQLIIRQGDADNDIYFILSGEVLISVNGRLIARRSAGNHVGEMAAIDVTSVRSASVAADGNNVIVLKVCEKDYSKIALDYPSLWRRMAAELAGRLRERNKFHETPNNQPMIFIGSTSESLGDAEMIAKKISATNSNTVPKPWARGVFEASRTAIEDLFKIIKQTDFAIFLGTPDDITVSRGKRKMSPRDNIIFEMGLFMGSLGRERVILLTPLGADIKIPSDLLGVTTVPYSVNKKNKNRFKKTVDCLMEKITALGPK